MIQRTGRELNVQVNLTPPFEPSVKSPKNSIYRNMSCGSGKPVFSHLKPLKRGGGRRYYRPEDMQFLRRIRDLLYMDGYTIKGVQKLLRESGGIRAFVEDTKSDNSTPANTEPAVTPPGRTMSTDTSANDALRPAIVSALTELRSLRDALRQSGET